MTPLGRIALPIRRAACERVSEGGPAYTGVSSRWTTGACVLGASEPFDSADARPISLSIGLDEAKPDKPEAVKL
jgi:hypothetical protein